MLDWLALSLGWRDGRTTGEAASAVIARRYARRCQLFAERAGGPMTTRPVKIAPSILSADFLRLGAQVSDALGAGVRRIHVDVMDGRFVPNPSIDPPVVAALRPLAERAGAVLEPGGQSSSQR